MALGQLVEGKWVSKRDQEDSKGRFLRPSTTFRDRITADGSSGFKAQPDRYHLYIPWANRTAIMRSLKGLEDAIGLSVVDPVMGEEGWMFSDFPGSIPDTVNGTQYLREIYLKADPQYTGRVTVPIIWDKERNNLHLY
jgi:putative glutathione S-transferase